MFTGIINEVGKVLKVSRTGGGASLLVGYKNMNEDLSIGDSIAVNGVCLSVVKFDDRSVLFDVVGNTYSRTNIKRLRPGMPVNLENAIKAGGRMSGHIVSGHIDGEREVIRNIRSDKGQIFEVRMMPQDAGFLVEKGSVAVDGVSLTVADIAPDRFRIYVIPLTLKETTLKFNKSGSYVNVEFDIMAKYGKKKNSENIDMDLLRRTGFIE